MQTHSLAEYILHPIQVTIKCPKPGVLPAGRVVKHSTPPKPRHFMPLASVHLGSADPVDPGARFSPEPRIGHLGPSPYNSAHITAASRCGRRPPSRPGTGPADRARGGRPTSCTPAYPGRESRGRRPTHQRKSPRSRRRPLMATSRQEGGIALAGGHVIPHTPTPNGRLVACPGTAGGSPRGPNGHHPT